MQEMCRWEIFAIICSWADNSLFPCRLEAVSSLNLSAIFIHLLHKLRTVLQLT